MCIYIYQTLWVKFKKNVGEQTKGFRLHDVLPPECWDSSCQSTKETPKKPELLGVCSETHRRVSAFTQPNKKAASCHDPNQEGPEKITSTKCAIVKTYYPLAI